MNEEEKKSIEEFRKQLRLAINVDDITTTIRNSEVRTILNLIEKLQKENEKLKDKLLDTTEGQKVIKEETPQYIKENYIPVQKVKDKIEELDIAILECEYSDDDSEEYKKEVEKDKLELLKQKSILQELL